MHHDSVKLRDHYASTRVQPIQFCREQLFSYQYTETDLVFIVSGTFEPLHFRHLVAPEGYH